jgi:hypothetical protein
VSSKIAAVIEEEFRKERKCGVINRKTTAATSNLLGWRRCWTSARLGEWGAAAWAPSEPSISHMPKARRHALPTPSCDFYHFLFLYSFVYSIHIAVFFV